MNNDISHEHGLTLSRLIAAERNAVSALAVLEELREHIQSQNEKIAKLGEQNAQLQQQMAGLNARLYSMTGTGATAA